MTALSQVRQTRRPVNTALHVSGVVLVVLSTGMAAAGVYESVDGGPEVGALLASAVITAVAGFVMWRGTRLPRRVTAASAFTAVTWTWLVASVAGALPFALAGVFDHLDDALFESVAGFTTTASTLFGGPEPVSDGILLWRSLLQWFGGAAAVTLAVAVLPLLGVGGLDAVRTEAPGQEPEQLAPWVAHAARRCSWLYAVATAAVLLGLALAGLGAFDAFTHAFGAVSTGGFSPRGGSAARFDSLPVEIVLMAGMLVGAVSFTLHWRAVHGEGRAYGRSPQFGAFLAWLAAAIGLVTLLNVLDGAAVARGLRDSAFAVVSIATTTGFHTADFSAWVPAAQMLLLVLVLAGAMTGSASGALKLLRVQVVFAHARRELRRARHPRGVFPLRLGGVTLPETVVSMVAGFVTLYLLVFLAGALALAALGSDLVTSLGVAGSALGNVGPGLGDVGPGSSFVTLSRPAHAVLDVLMVVGRVEIFPVLLALAAPARVVGQRRHPRRRAVVAPRDADAA